GIGWADAALGVFVGLPPSVQEQIRRRLEYVRDNPRMYPLSARGPHRGLRRFHVFRRWTVYYRFMTTEEYEAAEVVAIRPARARR
ncbi:MAG: hypothetical protein HY660_13635, partial [Armatimonadetes bacterium]|nr:hypothetical protein [Armatimonadota bacterium]